MEEDKVAGPNSQPGRILDRKIESRGLPESFSANISRKGTPSKSGRGRTVKALVDWLENTGGNGSREPAGKGPRAHDKGSSSKDVGDKHRESQHQAPQSPPRPTAPSVPPHPFAEDYSLTLLKFKSYFNNRPLARCLDDQDQYTQTKKNSDPQTSDSQAPPKQSQVMEKSPEGLGEDGTERLFVRDPAEVAAF